MNVARSVVPNQAWLLKGRGVVLSIWGGLLFRLHRTPAPARRRPRFRVLDIRGKAGTLRLLVLDFSSLLSEAKRGRFAYSSSISCARFQRQSEDASLTKFTYRRRMLPSQSVGKSPRNRFRKARNQGPDLQTRPHGNKLRLRQRIRKSCSFRHRPREPS
jgi:hypothetical protein